MRQIDPNSNSAGQDLRQSETGWQQGALLLLGVLLIWRVLYLILLPLALSPDESYYWDWARSLDWSYFSKPPMVAWLIAVSTAIFGNNDFGVRLPAALLGIGGLWFTFLLSRRMFDAKTAFWTVAAIASSIGFAAGGYLMTIDAPLFFFWCFALYAFWRWQEGKVGCGRQQNGAPGRPANHWLVLAIFACGLGLLSKLIMAVFGALALVFAFACWGASGKKAHAESAPVYLSARRIFSGTLLLIAGSLIFLIPFLLWNVRYDWITFQHTGGAFGGRAWTAGRTAGWSLGFIVSQIGLGSPVLMVLLILLLASLRRVVDRRVAFLRCFSAVPLTAVLLISFTQQINPNWPLVFYPAAYILLAAWACGQINTAAFIDKRRIRFRMGVYCGFALVIFFYVR